jgi:beta-xylosidase
MLFSKRQVRLAILCVTGICLSVFSYRCLPSEKDPEPISETLSIRLISPVRGIPGDTVVIQGTNFMNGVQVEFGVHPAEVLDVSQYKIVAIVPDGVESNTYVTVSLNNKVSNSLAFHFQVMEKLELADPTIFLFEDTYYVYGTGGKGGNVDQGFLVYSSSDLRKWNGPKGVDQGFSLIKDKAFGDWGFWAPQVFPYKGAIYMAYTANENIAIAKSNSPLGPFTEHAVLTGPTRQIDPYIFIDDDEKVYIYFARLSGGNKIYVAEMNEDLSAIRQETVQLCLGATDGWEDTQKINWTVVEGPTVLKNNDAYYLFYSANHFENRDYAVGYAVSESPMGPWVKFRGNPIISRELLGFNGTGHGDFFRDKDRQWRYVFHMHFDNSRVHPRLTAILTGAFSDDEEKSYPRMIFNKGTFNFLLLND